MTPRCASLLALAALSVALVSACGTWIYGADSAPPEASELVQDPRPARQIRSGRMTPRRRRDGPPAPASASVLASTPASAPPTDLEAVRVLQRSLLSTTPVAFAPATNPGSVLSLALEGSVRGEVDGLSQDGPILEAALEEGEWARTPRTKLDAPACITLVAQGGVGTVELDLFVLSGKPSAPRLLAEDKRGGPLAIIGGKTGCFLLDAGTDFEIIALMRKGSGSLLVLRFRK